MHKYVSFTWLFSFFNLLGVWLTHSAMFLVHGTVAQLCAHTAILFQVPAYRGHHRVLSTVPCAIQQALVGHLFYIQYLWARQSHTPQVSLPRVSPLVSIISFSMI